MAYYDIYVTALMHHAGVIDFAGSQSRCALGASGVTEAKSEGDGATPLGRFPLRRVWYRPDRWATPVCPLPIVEISQKSGWSDDIHDPDYNRPVVRPHGYGHEQLWRRDHLYDVFLELGYNDQPAVAGKGSAIFLHLEKNGYQATRGCVAVDEAMMRHILAHISLETMIDITQ